MAKTVEQQLRKCKRCRMKTLHYRNNKQISWLMHLVLTIFTAGAWLVIFFFVSIIHIFTKPLGGAWTCSQCGRS